jgi:two-component system chemotaxis response regulator CheY
MADLNTKFLVVDDFPTMRRIIRNLLKELGFNNVDEAEDGVAGLAKLKGGDFQFVVSDWNMPNMTGMQLLEALAADGIKLTFGFITTEATPDMRAKAMGAGAKFLISKPFTPESFQEQLGAHIR